MKIQKTHPALRQRFLRGNKYGIILSVVAHTTYTLTPWWQRSPVSALRLVERLVIITNTAVIDVGRCRRMPLI